MTKDGRSRRSLLFGLVLMALAGHQLWLSVECSLDSIPAVEWNATQPIFGEASLPPQHLSPDPPRSPSTTKDTSYIPLRELVQTSPETSCPPGLVLVNDTLLDNMDDEPWDAHSIPRVVHITAKSRCLTPDFAQLVDEWRLANHSVVLHNEAALERLILGRDWPLFPGLAQLWPCLPTGAAKADLWRALVLWEYGGIYTDLDNRPARFQGIDNDQDQAYFVVEQQGFLSQYFGAAVPRHALVYFWIQSLIHRVLNVADLKDAYPPNVTGPGALQQGFVHFMQAQTLQPTPGANASSSTTLDRYARFTKVRAGTYVGFRNWTVTVVGRQGKFADDYVARNVIYKKARLYPRMNMTHFGKASTEQLPANHSCWHHMYAASLGSFNSYNN